MITRSINNGVGLIKVTNSNGTMLCIIDKNKYISFRAVTTAVSTTDHSFEFKMNKTDNDEFFSALKHLEEKAIVVEHFKEDEDVKNSLAFKTHTETVENFNVSHITKKNTLLLVQVQLSPYCTKEKFDEEYAMMHNDFEDSQVSFVVIDGDPAKPKNIASFDMSRIEYCALVNDIRDIYDLMEFHTGNDDDFVDAYIEDRELQIEQFYNKDLNYLLTKKNEETLRRGYVCTINLLSMAIDTDHKESK